ncbi:MAG: inositol-1-monophosphatase [Rhodospirillaceae bacterium]|nr:inositol-1-monophosphatase [Rhodospirillaceae bacterium]
MSIVRSNHERVSELIRAAAVNIILPRFRALGEGEVDEKEGGELVTVADIESEAWLARHLPELVPGSVVVGEEAVFADRSVFERLSGDAPVWVIDPVDGTWNFANGRPTFAVIVAYVVRGEVEAGWIYEPVSERLAFGARGEGVSLDGRAISLGTAGGTSDFVGTAARYLRERAEAAPETVRQVFPPRCAGNEYIRILSGERSFSAYTKLLPWDHAAGSFLVREAGGHNALLNGGRYDLTRPKGDMLTATSLDVWETIRDVLAPGNADAR